MSGRGRPRKDALNIRRSKRKAEATEKPKRQKREEETVENGADHEVDQDHEVEETISLGGVGSEHQGIGIKNNQERPQGIIHFDEIFRNVPAGTNDPPEIEPLRCGDEGLSIHLPQQIVDKIQAGKYINLTLMLKSSIELAEFCSGNVLRYNFVNDSIESRQKISKQTIKNIDEWTDAFLIYSSVYLQKFPEKAIEILKYMSVIREAATRYPTSAWVDYDQQFRLRQANEASRQSWGSLNAEMWLRIMSKPSQSNTISTTSFKSKQPQSNSPVGYTNSLTCNAFNAGYCTWTPCKFRHACAACNSSLHGQSNCPHTLQSFPIRQQQATSTQGNTSFRGRGYSRGNSTFRGRRPFQR